jgi:hypothetical protein
MSIGLRVETSDGSLVTSAVGSSDDVVTLVQLSLDDELARLLQQHALQDRLAPVTQMPARDGACRLLHQLVRRGLSEPALPAAAALIVALDMAAGERS